MSCNNIQLIQNPDTITVRQPSSNIQITQAIEEVTVCVQNSFPQFKPFSFIATDNQSRFGPLDWKPVSIMTVGITGTLQNPAGNTPDYELDGYYIQLNAGIPEGNTVYGIVQIY